MKNSNDDDKRERLDFLADVINESGPDGISEHDLVIKASRQIYLYGFNEIALATVHNSTLRRRVSRDLQEIKASDDYPALCTKGRIHFLTSDEASEYIRTERARLFRAFRLLRDQERKIAAYGKIDLDGEEKQVFAHD